VVAVVVVDFILLLHQALEDSLQEVVTVVLV
jgi:hypothetical protein